MHRTLVLGLDGATFDVLNPLAAQGAIPNISELMDRGVHGPLESTLPPVTGPAWLSLGTGLSPGSTGVYDFIKRQSEGDGFEFTYLDSGQYEGRAVWDFLGAAGVDVGVIDYPTLTPAYEVNGFMLSGGLGSTGPSACPADLNDRLEAFERPAGHIDIGDSKYKDLNIFYEDILDNLNRRVAIIEYLLESESWEFCWAVLQEPDWVQHLMWKCFDETHPEHPQTTTAERELFVDFWKEIDSIVGRFLATLDEETNVVIQSDHGFGPMYDTSFRINTWLQNEGHLVPKSMGGSHFWVKKRLWNTLSTVVGAVRLKEWAPSLFNWGKNELSVMAIELGSINLDESTVFDPGHIQSMGGLYVNEKVVTSPKERRQVVEEVREKLETFGEENGLDLRIATPEEVYGKRTQESPSLLVTCEGVNIENDGWSRPIIDHRPERISHQNGSHRKEGVFIAAGPDFSEGSIEDARVWDVAPTLLHVFNQSVPKSMDGKVLESALDVQQDIKYREYDIDGGVTPQLSEDEQHRVHKQLSDLGYFE